MTTEEQLKQFADMRRQLQSIDQPFEVFHGRSGGRKWERTVEYYQQLIELIESLEPGNTIVIVRPAPKQEFDGDMTYRFNGGPEHKIDMSESLATLSEYFDEKFAESERDIRQYAESKGIGIIDAFKGMPGTSFLFNEPGKPLPGISKLNQMLLDEAQLLKVDQIEGLIHTGRAVLDAMDLKQPVKGSRRGRNIKPDKSKKARYS